MARKRNDSTIIKIRLFHNWIKKKLIDEAVKYLNSNYDNNNISLLDLAVGRGGDLQKWTGANIHTVVGFDIDKESIDGKNGAKDRFNMLEKKLGKKFNYEFHIMDLSLPKNLTPIDKIINDRKFNIISCQFAIHYFFEKKQALNNFFSIVSKYLEKDGFFIGTTLNGKTIYDLTNGHEYNNPTFNVKIDTYDENNLYSNKYTISLGDKNEDHYFRDKPSVEYMVDVNELKKIGEEHGLLFLGITNFTEWYDKYVNSNSNKYNKYNNPRNNQLSDNEKVFSFLNFSFIFTKK